MEISRIYSRAMKYISLGIMLIIILQNVPKTPINRGDIITIVVYASAMYGLLDVFKDSCDMFVQQ